MPDSSAMTEPFIYLPDAVGAQDLEYEKDSAIAETAPDFPHAGHKGSAMMRVAK